jgi:hypothetical protein
VSGRPTPCVDMAANHDRVTARSRGLFEDQAHLAVVEQQRVTGPQCSENFRTRKLDPGVGYRAPCLNRARSFAILELDRAFGERGPAEFGSRRSTRC